MGSSYLKKMWFVVKGVEKYWNMCNKASSRIFIGENGNIKSSLSFLFYIFRLNISMLYNSYCSVNPTHEICKYTCLMMGRNIIARLKGFPTQKSVIFEQSKITKSSKHNCFL